MDPRVGPLHARLHLNTRLLLNCLDGLDDTVGHGRPNERTNSIGFIGAHLVDARHLLAQGIGVGATSPWATDRIGCLTRYPALS